jgi:hypothetical protein
MRQGQWETVSEAENPFKTKMRIATNGDLEVEYDQTNMSEVLDINVALQNADRGTSSLWSGRDYVHAARIPNEVLHQWMREGVNFFRWNEQDRARVMQKLNDADFSKLRTDTGCRI